MSFELGINYWPRKSAMYMWEEFDIGEVRQDMVHIADMGFEAGILERRLDVKGLVDRRFIPAEIEAARIDMAGAGAP